MDPLVSVVIPCYNAEKTIVRTLNSIDRCGYANLEIIAVNDGSSDSTGKILEAAAKIDHRIKVLHQSNAGVSSARNIGVDNATSEYIAFIDADDIFYPGCISERIKLLIEDNSEDLLGVFCPAVLLDDSLKQLSKTLEFNYTLPLDRLYFGVFTGCPFNPTATILKKSKFIDAGGFDQHLAFAEDYELWQRMMQKGGYFKQAHDCCVGWIQHKASATRGNRIKNFNNKKQVIDRLFCATKPEQTAQENLGGLGVCYYNDTVSRAALLDALNAAIAGQLDDAEAIAKHIAPSYLEKVDFVKFNYDLEFCTLKTLCQPEVCWPYPLWSKIKNNVFELLGRISSKSGRKNENVLFVLEKLRNYDSVTPLGVACLENAEVLRNTIELLSPDLIDKSFDLAQAILKRSNKLGIGMGWHYILDLIWIINNVSRLPKGSRILDAGAGNGLLQFLLADLGYTVISADFAARTPPASTRRTHRILEITTGNEYDNAYIKHLESEFKTQSSGAELRLTSESEFEALLSSNPQGTIFYYRTDICNLQLIKDDSIDAVVSLSALEHNNHELFSRAIMELSRVVKPFGAIIATVSATDRSEDWYHEPSKGWCYTERSLENLFGLSGQISNFKQCAQMLQAIKESSVMKNMLAPFYFQSGNNGMPWGVWNPQYCPVGVIKSLS